jgi:hypothetical protein
LEAIKVCVQRVPRWTSVLYGVAEFYGCRVDDALFDDYFGDFDFQEYPDRRKAFTA